MTKPINDNKLPFSSCQKNKNNTYPLKNRMLKSGKLTVSATETLPLYPSDEDSASVVLPRRCNLDNNDYRRLACGGMSCFLANQEHWDTSFIHCLCTNTVHVQGCV